jgi:hypothetical protein
MHGAIPPLPNMPSWRGAQLKAQKQLYLLYLLHKFVQNPTSHALKYMLSLQAATDNL